MRRCVIFAGAGISDHELLRSYLRDDDFNIFCDGGLRHMEAMGLRADLIVGDFDSHPRPDLDVPTIALPRAKDDTDSAYAVKEALRRGFDEFLLAGVIGGRIDHTMGNLSLLLMLDQLGKKALAVDDYSETEIVSGREAFIEDCFPYFSLLAFGGDAEDVTIEDAKFPLAHAAITCSDPCGISNEPLPGKTAKVTVGKGSLLLVRVRKG